MSPTVSLGKAVVDAKNIMISGFRFLSAFNQQKMVLLSMKSSKSSPSFPNYKCNCNCDDDCDDDSGNYYCVQVQW